MGECYATLKLRLRLFSPTTMFLVFFDPSLDISVLTFKFGMTFVMYDVAGRLLLLCCRPFILFLCFFFLLVFFLPAFISSHFVVIRSYIISYSSSHQLLFPWFFHRRFFPITSLFPWGWFTFYFYSFHIHSIGLPSTRFSPHSLRVGGLVTLFAADVPDNLKQLAGRWASAKSFVTYARATFQQFGTIARSLNDSSLVTVQHVKMFYTSHR